MPDTGWLDFGSISSTGTGGENAWSTPSNAASQDDTVATSAGLTDSQLTEWLYGANPNPGIPATATIVGVEFRVDKYGGDGSNVQDESIKITTDGVTFSGDDQSIGSLFPSTDTDLYSEYGGPTDVWGLSLTPAIVNGVSFGVGFKASKASIGLPDPDANVDHMQIKIHYSMLSEGGGQMGANLSQPVGKMIGY